MMRPLSRAAAFVATIALTLMAATYAWTRYAAHPMSSAPAASLSSQPSFGGFMSGHEEVGRILADVNAKMAALNAQLESLQKQQGNRLPQPTPAT